MDMKKILQSLDGASKKPVEGSNDMKRFMQIIEGKGPLNRLTQAESIAMQEQPKKKTITSPVLNVVEDAKPGMIGKYFKSIEQELLEAEQRHKDRASILAKRITERVTIGPDGKVTGGLKPTPRDPNAEPRPSAPSEPPATMPGKDLPRADSANKQAGTVTIDGQEYKMVMLEPGGIRPRGGQRIAIPQAIMGERGIGNYIGVLAGNNVYVLPLGERESIEQMSEELEQLFDLRNKIEEAIKQRLDPKCWKNKKIGNPKTKIKGGVRVNNCVPKESVQKTGPAGQLKGKAKPDVKGTVLGSKEKSQKGLRNKLVGGGA